MLLEDEPPVMVIAPVLSPGGAAAQSMLAQRRISSTTLPDNWLSGIQGCEAVAVHEKPALPLVNTTMNRRSSPYEEKLRGTASAPIVCPSTATPSGTADGAGTAASAGRPS